MTNFRKTISSLLLVLSLVSLTSCGSSNFASKATDSMNDTAYSENSSQMFAPSESFEYDGADYDFGGDYSSDEYGYAAEEAKTEQTENDLSARKIIKNATLNFDTQSFDGFLESLNARILASGGYTQSSETYGDSYYSSSSRYRSAYVVVRIPADRYDAFIADAGKLGSLTYKSESVDDVTMAYSDTESRVKALRAVYDMLLDILSKAESLNDVISLQSRISEVSYQIDSYESKLRQYDNLISYCTVRINVNEVSRETAPVYEQTFADKIRLGLDETFGDIADGAESFAVWFVVNLPYIIIWAIIIAAAVIVIKLIISRAKKKRDRRAAEKFLREMNTKNNENKDNKENKTE